MEAIDEYKASLEAKNRKEGYERRAAKAAKEKEEEDAKRRREFENCRDAEDYQSYILKYHDVQATNPYYAKAQEMFKALRGEKRGGIVPPPPPPISLADGERKTNAWRPSTRDIVLAVIAALTVVYFINYRTIQRMGKNKERTEQTEQSEKKNGADFLEDIIKKL